MILGFAYMHIIMDHLQFTLNHRLTISISSRLISYFFFLIRMSRQRRGFRCRLRLSREAAARRFARNSIFADKIIRATRMHNARKTKKLLEFCRMYANVTFLRQKNVTLYTCILAGSAAVTS